MLRGVLFDVFGTLLDVFSVAQRAESLFPGEGARLAAVWRDKQIEYSRLRTMSDRYVPFWQVTRDALEFSLESMRLSSDDATKQQLLAAYDELTPFPEALSALQRLRAAGIAVGVLSNGDPPMLERALAASGLKPLLQWVLSADQVQAYKTSSKVYALGARALSCDAADIAFVSANGWDVCGARWYGYAAFWVNRDSRPLERLGVQPSAVGKTLDDAADYALAANRIQTQ